MAYNDTMLNMIQKIRAITEDFEQTTSETFTYEDSNIFTIAEPRVGEIVEDGVKINGADLSSLQDYDFDPSTNDITVTNDDFESGDIVKVTYTFYKQTASEIFEYVRSALVFLSIYDNSVPTYKLSTSGMIIPSPFTKDLDLICMIASILIKPDFVSYKTSNMSVVYPTKMTKEEKIEKLIKKLKYGIGTTVIASWDKYPHNGGLI